MTEVVNQITGEVFESGFTGELNKNSIVYMPNWVMK